MKVEFRKTGARRYAVRAHRSGFPSVEANPAPGYDDRLPHDLVHFVVEEVLGIRNGVFGQLAAGGDSGTFRLDTTGGSSRDDARSRRKAERRAAPLSRSGHRDSLFSEHAANIGLHAWLARSGSEKDRARARETEPFVRREWELCTREEAARLSSDALDRICNRLDAVSAAWSGIGTGESILLPWSDGRG